MTSVVAEPTPIAVASAPGRIVAFADSDFLRDDFARGAYRQLGGPHSLFGAAFFPMLLDWLSQDSDLVALQSRLPADRRITLVDDLGDGSQDRLAAEKKLRTTQSFLVTMNVVSPCLLVLILGFAVLFVRRSQKRRFLSSVEN